MLIRIVRAASVTARASPELATQRFNRTMLEEWAYSQPYLSEAERAACFNDWLHTSGHSLSTHLSV